MGKRIGPLDFNDLSISPNYRVQNYVVARNNNDWPTLVRIFDDRIEGRFLKPIKLISDDPESSEYAGFLILAIDCLLIETLCQFYNGWDETDIINERSFRNFFKKSDHFKNHFSNRKSATFYSHIRCGLLHQAQTKKKTVVRIDQAEMIQKSGNRIEEGIIVDRVKFHSSLKQEIHSYKGKLLDNDAVLRGNFIQKMNFICEL